MDRLKELIKKCDECKMHECIGCEICWIEVQAIKKLLKEYKKYKKLANKNIDNEIILREKNAPEDIYVLQSRIEELEAEVESQDKTIDKLVEEQQGREKYTHSLEEENAMLKKVNNIAEDVTVEDITQVMNKSLEEFKREFIPISVIQNKIDELTKYRDLAKEQIEERVVIADSDSLNYGRAEAHDKDIQVLQKLLEERNK